MKKIKPFFLAAKSKKAQHTLKVLSQKYNNYDLKVANIVVVLGGDGTTLSLISDNMVPSPPNTTTMLDSLRL